MAITSDKYILDMVQHGYRIELSGPITTRPGQRRHSFTVEQSLAISSEVEKLLDLGVISSCGLSRDGIVSPIFTVPKANGDLRMILNLKEFNKNVEYRHFKMENFHVALSLISQRLSPS